jgi:hypothetical protein
MELGAVRHPRRDQVAATKIPSASARPASAATVGLPATRPPCSQGPGAKTYTFTLYALSATPDLSAAGSTVNGSTITSAIGGNYFGFCDA